MLLKKHLLEAVLFTLAVKTTYVVLTQVFPKSIKISGMASLNILTGLTLFTGPSVLSVLTGTIYVLMIVRLPTSGVLSTGTLDALTLSVRLVASELLLTLKLVTLLTVRLFPIVVTALVSVVIANIRSALSKWRPTGTR